ncbi:MAG TPA: adenylate/guanylate cyclase domain-containing protein [Actinomycetota bacterium]|jgi:guanylate cyclase|nr:adenylate/guanylate cyclase domain-containing protein [Actinomycetota bacterium]
MADRSWWRRALEPVLAIGEYPGEPETRRSGRRVFLVAFVIATVFTIPQAMMDIAAGYTVVGVMNLVSVALTVPFLVAMKVWPHRFAALVNGMFVLVFVTQLAETAMFGGLFPSGLVVIFGLALGLAALIAIGLRAAIWWTVAFAASVIYALEVPDRVDPIYELANPAADAAFNLVATSIVVLAVLAYFVRQRDLYQRRSDDLLHAILPDEIVPRLKEGRGTIADDLDQASVLFADVVDFTPMSASLAPAQLVELLDEVFSCFDAYVAELGLERIKTVGDAYMAAAGVPRSRPDHAHAIADLALRIRDHEAVNPVDGSRLSFRIGISSGPVTAGVIGTRTFSYDLWGDTVNTASRMESTGVPGAVQIAAATCELVRDAFICEPRGLVAVKGKQEMETFLLVGRAP